MSDHSNSMPPTNANEFLSCEDLDLKNLSWEELLAWWDWWLLEAQKTNDLDKNSYSHGVFQLVNFDD